MTEDWQERAACRDTDPDLFIGDHQDERAAKAICSGCPVIDECLTYALSTHSHWGVWGGKGEEERRLIRKRLGLSVAPRSMRAGLPGQRRTA